MSRRAYLVLTILACGLALPVIIGASCPPPDNPPFFSPSAGLSTIGLGLPLCEPDRVCISIINRACTETDVTLYIHDGYDFNDEFVTRTALECCESANATAPCPCPRPGSGIGELQLQPPELYRASNRALIAGETIVTLDPQGGRVLISLPCMQVKSIGVEMATEGGLPISPQEQSNVNYRCSMVPIDRGDEGLPEDVACGATIQFTISDRNNCSIADQPLYRVETDVSANCFGQ